MSEAETFTGTCFCGAVRVEVTGPPLRAGYCHCASCQRVHGAPFIVWGAWKEADVAITEGADVVREFNKSGEPTASTRLFCSRCGGRVGNRRKHSKTTIVYASTLRDAAVTFEPSLHIHYGERVMDLADGLPKYVDAPGKWGGSDQTVEEPSRSGPRA